MRRAVRDRNRNGNREQMKKTRLKRGFRLADPDQERKAVRSDRRVGIQVKKEERGMESVHKRARWLRISGGALD